VKPVFSQFVLYSAVGAVGTVTHFTILIILVQGLGVGPVPASMAGFVTAVLVNYCLNYHVTFKSSNPHNTALLKFFTVALVGLSLNTLIMAVLVRWLYYLVCQVIAIPLVLMWNFTCNRRWTFGGTAEG
jgi:putative flippase GtrA